MGAVNLSVDLVKQMKIVAADIFVKIIVVGQMKHVFLVK